MTKIRLKSMYSSVKNFFKKLKVDPKDAVTALGVFLAVFAFMYWRTSWNTKPISEKSSQNDKSFAESINFNDQSLAAAWGILLSDYNNWASQNSLSGQNAKLDADPDGDGLPNYLEYLHGTDPAKRDTDGDGYTDEQEIVNGYDPDAPGDARPAVDVSISKIGVTAPMVWSASDNEKDQLADLAKGVAHFPKTAAPGQIGNMIISGHSSNYVWASGNYNYIFKGLNNLVPGDVVDVKTVQQNGKIIMYHYKINEKFTTVPDDARIFENTDASTLTLSTCWPLGTNLRRLIVKGEMAH